jgi:leucyl/phenylalanyl-tRNA--protein transferase
MKLPWLQPGDPFPPADAAWGPGQPAPGLLAAGGALDVDTLVRAYSGGIFPWFSADQPILWWSTAPRMVLPVREFVLHRSLRKTLQRWVKDANAEVRFDSVLAMPTVLKPGSTANWWAACTVWLSAGRCLASRCLRAAQMRPSWHCVHWSPIAVRMGWR